MILFFIEHASSFLTMGIATLSALLLRTAARMYAGKEDREQL